MSLDFTIRESSIIIFSGKKIRTTKAHRNLSI